MERRLKGKGGQSHDRQNYVSGREAWSLCGEQLAREGRLRVESELVERSLEVHHQQH